MRWRQPGRRSGRLALALLAAMLLGLAAFPRSLPASELDERRLQISLAVFPRIVAVDGALAEKLTPNRRVRLLVVYHSDHATAEQVVEQLNRNVRNIGGFPVEVAKTSAERQAASRGAAPTAMIVVERLADGLFADLNAQAIVRHVLVFSPFAGDVERGAAAGIVIDSRIRPHFNLTSLRRSAIRIDPALLDVSRHHD